ncbi:FtsK/SpoIIIE domain-containing protein [Allostreptomyces psammosilenae]|uniref:FtsK domain-containing protein n=1 Tax=Allostreptomyces psammosilenae TaxID=1892865 RepID=A0A852ZPF9_9ACTN|nr:FtsK/SpoIIIE domain-containing protein [Allostreptomyces psammosilenae]NYI04273.1 hypothetical protein [Allostreptomyces psammosilenae]
MTSSTARRGATARARHLARSAGAQAREALQPLLLIWRGARRGATRGLAWLRGTPAERRNSTLFLTALAVGGVTLFVPYGPALTAAALVGGAAWLGRDPDSAPPGPAGDRPAGDVDARLQALYDGLAPYLPPHPNDPHPLYLPGAPYQRALVDVRTDREGRPTALTLRYPGHFTDTEAPARARIEHVVRAKTDPGREYLFQWDPANTLLHVTALEPLRTDITTQPFVTGPGELVLGFTDPAATNRLIPVLVGAETLRAAPLLWRGGGRSGEPHLLAIGHPGSGRTTLLRALANQVPRHGDLVVVDATGAGEYAYLTGRPGVLTVADDPSTALATLDWLAGETARRTGVVTAAKRHGHPPPADARRPLWVLLDGLTELVALTPPDRPDPRELLSGPARHGRGAGVALAITDTPALLGALPTPLADAARARVVLGHVRPEEARAFLGTPLGPAGPAWLPPGRGWARLGNGPVLRLQVPYAPDPFDEDTGAAERAAVLAQLPAPTAAPAAWGGRR